MTMHKKVMGRLLLFAQNTLIRPMEISSLQKVSVGTFSKVAAKQKKKFLEEFLTSR